MNTDSIKTTEYQVYNHSSLDEIYFINKIQRTVYPPKSSETKEIGFLLTEINKENFPNGSLECQNAVVIKKRLDDVKELISTNKYLEGGQEGNMGCGDIWRRFKNIIVATLDGYASSDALLRTMFVEDSFRGKEIGMTLFKNFSSIAKQHNFKKMSGELAFGAPGNLVEYYQKLGATIDYTYFRKRFFIDNKDYNSDLRILTLDTEQTKKLNELEVSK